MNPDKLNQQPSFDLPAPNPEAGKLTPPANPEAASVESQGEMPTRAELPQAAPPPLIDPAAAPSAAATSSDPPASAQSAASPAMADDADLIEKEWVEKAKALVEQAKDDPHAQNKALSKFKADYMKKRYNKDIQVE